MGKRCFDKLRRVFCSCTKVGVLKLREDLSWWCTKASITFLGILLEKKRWTRRMVRHGRLTVNSIGGVTGFDSDPSNQLTVVGQTRKDASIKVAC